MKLLNVFTAFLLMFNLSVAQTPITITNMDMPNSGDTIRYSITSNI